MRKVMMMVLGVCALVAVLAAPTAAAPDRGGSMTKRGWVFGPATCVRVWNYRSRQTRYGGAPRCRRMPV
jgi:hypothetical protein